MNILDDCFGLNSLNRIVYMHRKSLPTKALSLISCFKENPIKVVGTISFYRVFVEKTDCLLLGPLKKKKKYQDKGFGKKLVEIGFKKARSNNEKICFVSG